MLPKRGKNSHNEPPPAGAVYPLAIAFALKGEFGDSRHAIKTISRWTGASGRTVRDWLSAIRGPSGEHLVALAKHSPAVHSAYLALSGRADAQARDVDESLALLREVIALLSRPH